MDHGTAASPYSAALHTGYLAELPGADRMPWWCGGWGLNTPGYPIRSASTLAETRRCDDVAQPFYPERQLVLDQCA